MKKLVLLFILALFIFDANSQVPVYTLDVAKTATTEYVRTWEWTLTESVIPNEWDLFTGDQGISQFTLIGVKSPWDSDWRVEGDITIVNNTPLEAVITDISDVITPGNISAALSCPVSFPFTLAPGESLNCRYSADLPDGASTINTVTVTTSGDVGGGIAVVDVIFGEPTTEVNASVEVVDDSGTPGDEGDDRSWNFEGNFTVIYAKAFNCNNDEGENTTTAQIYDETGSVSLATAQATVNVNCYALNVAKDVSTSYDLDWSWTIDKNADQTDLILSTGQQFLVNYTVDIDATGVAKNWEANGNILISNNSLIDATITSISDLISPDILAPLDCGITFPFTLLAGESLNCTYSAVLLDESHRTNVAVVTLQNYSYASNGSATANGTTDFEASVDVDFSDATVTEIDECVDVDDSNLGSFGIFCASETPVSIFYGQYVGPFEDCGQYINTNTATITTNDRGIIGSDNFMINIDVPCNGCTLTPGYWKTHNSSFKGGASENTDETWELIGTSAELEGFFLSEQTYYEVLWTSPMGNVYYILAQAYIATELNLLKGTSAPQEVLTAILDAEYLLNEYMPYELSALKGKGANALRNQFTNLAEILDNYNNGIIGPGHCSEEVNTLALREADKSAQISAPLETMMESSNLKVYPNPFNNQVSFEFTSPVSSQAKIDIYDIIGRKVRTIYDGSVKENTQYKVEFKPQTDASSLYFYEMIVGEVTFKGKLIYNKE